MKSGSTPKTKNSLNSGHTAVLRPRRKKGLSAEKIMTAVFWNSHGISLADYVEKRKTIHWLKPFIATIEQQNHKETENTKVLFREDNAAIHKSAFAVA